LSFSRTEEELNEDYVNILIIVAPEELGENMNEEAVYNLNESKQVYKDLGI